MWKKPKITKENENNERNKNKKRVIIHKNVSIIVEKVIIIIKNY